jgi:hypothetical protein
VNINVISPDGTFCSVNRPDPSTAALMDVPATDTVIADPAGRTEALPTPDITTPVMLVPVTGLLVEGDAVDREGAAGEATSFLPHALTITATASAIAVEKPANVRIQNLRETDSGTLRFRCCSA